MDKKELTQAAYDGAMVAVGVFGLSFASNKLLKDGLGTTGSMKGMAKLGAAIIGSAVLIEYLKEKKYIKPGQ